MNLLKEKVDYWFVIEPYVFINVTKNDVLLYNTLDFSTLESDNKNVVDLLTEILIKENCGVVRLTSKKHDYEELNNFICELRRLYMGDIIEVALSIGKPVQLLPYYNYNNGVEFYKKHNFSLVKNVLENLSEITVHLDKYTNVEDIILFLLSISTAYTLNLEGNLADVANSKNLLSFLNQYDYPKNILCSYENWIPLSPDFYNNFSYRILVQFPIDMNRWNRIMISLLDQVVPFEYIFEVASEEEHSLAEQFVDEFRIKKYKLTPVYTGHNIRFFEDYVYLTKKDILSTKMTMKDFFTRQEMNIYNFGKIHILPSGDVYANLNHLKLGNISEDGIYEMLQKEVDSGDSWLHVRDQYPCKDCLYQWICPPPSDYEEAIGRPNLCHVYNNL